MTVPRRRSTWRREAIAPSAVLFAIMTAHALLETARDALFIARLGPDRLALAYLAIAACALLAITSVRRWARVIDPRRVLLGFLVAAVIGTAVLAVAIAVTTSAVFVLYVWTGLVATLIVPSFWTVIDRAAPIGEAKRAFAVVGAGGVLGALVGSALAAVLARVFEPRHLVTAGAVGFGLATLAAVMLAPRPDGDAPVVTEATEDATIDVGRSRRLLRLLVVLGVASTITLTIGDLTFKRVVAERLAPDELAATFGMIYTALNVVGLVVQLAIAPRLLAGIGVGGALTVLPLIVGVSALGFAMTGAMIAMVALKLGDGGLRHSVHRVGSEILFLPVPASLRDGSKPVVDALGQRGGQALAALIVLGTASVAGSRVLAAITAVAAVGWLIGLTLARRAYVSRFREMLRSGEVRRNVRVPVLDRESVELLTEALASPDEIEALASLDLLIQCRGQIPALALYHPRHRVVRRALAVLESQGRPEVGRVLGHLLEHPDPEIRAITLVASQREGADRELLARMIDDPHPAVRAAAAVLLAGEPDPAASAAAVGALCRGTVPEQVALARAIGHAPHPRFAGVLHELLLGGEPAVMRETLLVFERSPELVELEPLLAALADAHVRAHVRRVFLATGARGFARLVAALDDPATALAVRQHLPRTISRFGTRDAAAVLVTRLARELDATTELKILRALGRMRTEDPALAVDTRSLRGYVRRAIAEAARFATLCDHLDADAATVTDSRLLRDLLGERREQAIERAFRALGIMFPRAGMRSVHDALVSTDEARRGAAREIVDDVVPSELRAPLYAVIDDLPPAQRRARLGELAPGPFPSYEAVVAALLAERSDSLRCVVAHHVAERRLVALRGELARMRPTAGSPLVTRAFDQAIARLDA